MSATVFAVIVLANPISRVGSDRWGKFVRGRGMKEHRWLGDQNEGRLTPEQFNEEFPKAIRFAGPDRPLVGRIYVDGEDGPPAATILVADHEAALAELQAACDAKVADIQEEVNAWTAKHNEDLAGMQQKLEAAQARIAELERVKEPIQIVPPTEGDPISEAGDAPADTNLPPEVPGVDSGLGTVPDPAGAQGPGTSPEDPKSKPSKKKAKKG